MRDLDWRTAFSRRSPGVLRAKDEPRYLFWHTASTCGDQIRGKSGAPAIPDPGSGEPLEDYSHEARL